MEQRYLYLMISKTDTRVGWLIRWFSHFPYNHVSLSLDPQLRRWVSFGRYNRHAPFYSGFITESPERYLARGFDIRVRIFRLPLTGERYRELRSLFSFAGDRACGLVYNTFDMLAAAFHRQVEIPGAYTCLGFARAVLGASYRDIIELDEALRPSMIYDGPLSQLTPDNGSRTDHYFDSMGFFHGAWSTAAQLAVLTGRVFGDCTIELPQFYCR